jgi:hypothetical protein
MGAAGKTYVKQPLQFAPAQHRYCSPPKGEPAIPQHPLSRISNASPSTRLSTWLVAPFPRALTCATALCTPSTFP